MGEGAWGRHLRVARARASVSPEARALAIRASPAGRHSAATAGWFVGRPAAGRLPSGLAPRSVRARLQGRPASHEPLPSPAGCPSIGTPFFPTPVLPPLGLEHVRIASDRPGPRGCGTTLAADGSPVGTDSAIGAADAGGDSRNARTGAARRWDRGERLRCPTVRPGGCVPE